MELKKNPQADLNRDSGLYFVIGLTIVLFITWRALEYKTYPKTEELAQVMNLTDDLKEDVPITEVIHTAPPPPPTAAPEVIEIVEDLDEIEETVIESTEMNQETVIQDAGIVSAEEVNVYEEEEEISVPFAIIENVPIFPGCESAKNNDERKACFQQRMQAHIQKEFKYPEIALNMGIKGRVYVQFVIDSKGYVTGVRSRGPDKNLQQEAERIIASLPQMKPGIQRGRPVQMPYAVPINFIMKTSM